MPQEGCGNALRAGIEGAQGKFVIMADFDASYGAASGPILSCAPRPCFLILVLCSLR